MSDETDEATDTLADGEPAAEADAAKALEEAVAQWQDKYVRLQAEFDNYRKRTLKEKMDLVQTGGRDVLLEMLPVRDDVQRAVDAMQKSDDLEALRAGVTLISQKFTEALRRKGVTEIEVLDKEFDETEVYKIVGSQEADPMNGVISEDSPFGKALLGKNAGDEVTVDAPAGPVEYKILKVER